MATEAKTLRVTYKKSAIGYKKNQKDTIAALGFKKLGQTQLADNPGIRGMLHTVAHLVTVAESK